MHAVAVAITARTAFCQSRDLGLEGGGTYTSNSPVCVGEEWSARISFFFCRTVLGKSSVFHQDPPRMWPRLPAWPCIWPLPLLRLRGPWACKYRVDGKSVGRFEFPPEAWDLLQEVVSRINEW
jgi:hypothetical protein